VHPRLILWASYSRACPLAQTSCHPSDQTSGKKKGFAWLETVTDFRLMVHAWRSDHLFGQAEAERDTNERQTLLPWMQKSLFKRFEAAARSLYLGESKRWVVGQTPVT
jgi:hypothetical protein